MELDYIERLRKLIYISAKIIGYDGNIDNIYIKFIRYNRVRINLYYKGDKRYYRLDYQFELSFTFKYIFSYSFEIDQKNVTISSKFKRLLIVIKTIDLLLVSLNKQGYFFSVFKKMNLHCIDNKINNFPNEIKGHVLNIVRNKKVRLDNLYHIFNEPVFKVFEEEIKETTYVRNRTREYETIKISKNYLLDKSETLLKNEGEILSVLKNFNTTIKKNATGEWDAYHMGHDSIYKIKKLSITHTRYCLRYDNTKKHIEDFKITKEKIYILLFIIFCDTKHIEEILFKSLESYSKFQLLTRIEILFKNSDSFYNSDFKLNNFSVNIFNDIEHKLHSIFNADYTEITINNFLINLTNDYCLFTYLHILYYNFRSKISYEYIKDNKGLYNLKCYKNNITKEWWDSLNIEWKKLLVYNLYFLNETDIKEYKNSGYNYTNKIIESSIDISCYKIENILAALKKIKLLFIYETKGDLSILSQFKSLENLIIIDNGYNLQPLSELSNLKCLVLYKNIRDLNSISKLINLEKLYLFKNINELDPISKLINLKELDLSGNNRSLNPISKLEKLEYLRINNICSYDNDLSFLSSLTSLTKLFLNGNQSDLKHLSNLSNLKYLELNENEKDLSNISFLKSLEILKLNENEKDLSPISKLENLTYLELNNNNSPLKFSKHQNKLKVVYLNGNKQNLEPLIYLFNLEELHMLENNMNPIHLYKLMNLKKVYLTDNTQDLYCINNYLFEIITKSGFVKINNKTSKIKILNLNEENEKWWNMLSKEWKEILLQSINADINKNHRRYSLDSENIKYNPYTVKKILDLKEINIDTYDHINTLSPLTRLVKLEVLSIEIKLHTINKLNSFPLSYLINLKELIIDCYRFNSFLFFSELKNITKLKLKHADFDLDLISTLISLEELVLINPCVEINFIPLSNMKKLKRIRIIIQGIDISVKEYFKSLTEMLELKDIHIDIIRE